MSKLITFLTIAITLLLVSCNNEPTLQKYFVENSDKKDFIALDVAPSILNLDKQKLAEDEKRALASIENINMIAFKADDKNKANCEVEKKKVIAILKDKKYQELMHIGSGSNGASVSFVGEDDKIEEFVLYGNEKEHGFALIRIVGKNMNPEDLMTMIALLKKSNIDFDQFSKFQSLIN
jgi:aspartokinase